MNKAEKNAQIQAAVEAFLLGGGQIKQIPAVNKKIKLMCHGSASNTVIKGGDSPVMRISSLYAK